jgi:hypothetical protein
MDMVLILMVGMLFWGCGLVAVLTWMFTGRDN